MFLLFFFGGFCIVSLCFRCLYLFLYLLANFVFALFLISRSCFPLFCWLGSFVLLLFLNVLVFFQKCFLFFVCVVLFSLSLTLSDKNYKFLVSMFAFCSKNFNPSLSSFLFLNAPFSNTVVPFCMHLQLCKWNLFYLFFPFW